MHTCLLKPCHLVRPEPPDKAPLHTAAQLTTPYSQNTCNLCTHRSCALQLEDMRHLLMPGQPTAMAVSPLLSQAHSSDLSAAAAPFQPCFASACLKAVRTWSTALGRALNCSQANSRQPGMRQQAGQAVKGGQC